MYNHTGENPQVFSKLIQMTRLASFFILFLHFYYYCYFAFQQWKFTGKIAERLLQHVIKTGLFNNPSKSKLIALGLLAISLLGSKGRKDDKITYRSGIYIILAGLAVYFGSWLFLRLDMEIATIARLYMSFTLLGFLLVWAGGVRLSRVLGKLFRKKEPFDKANEGFPQEERLIRTDYSINLPTSYTLKGKTRDSWVNFINPRRGILILGSPGSGKTYFLIENMIRQFAEKGFALFVYDLKYDDLSRLAYAQFIKHRKKYPAAAQFYSINFTDLSRSHRCNVIDPKSMDFLADAIGASRTIFLGINKSWVNREGDFFVESPVNFLAAIIWFLRKYKDGTYCTLPHAIELAQTPYDKLFTILNTEPEIATLINPFINAYRDKVMEMLDGQISSAKIPLGRLASPELYYVLTGNDLSLEINDPAAPKILCLGGDPQKQEALAPVLSLYIDRVNKLINKRGKHPCAMICDEFASVRAAGVLATFAHARSNNIVPVIAVQDLSQLRTRYSRDEADLILNITGNLVCGQVGGETARWVSERFPRTMQDRTTVSSNSSDTSLSKTQQPDFSILPSTIATLSSGEFLGILTDDPGQKLELKAFHARIVSDHAALEKERRGLGPLPVIRLVDQQTIQENFQRVKQEVGELVQSEMKRILEDSELEGCVVRRKD